jgi:hypothetical protein
MTRYERQEFELFCQQATDAQVNGIVIKEREAVKKASANTFRAECLKIALFEQRLRQHYSPKMEQSARSATKKALHEPG